MRTLVYSPKPIQRFYLSCRALSHSAQASTFDSGLVDRPIDHVDVCIVGAGPAGLSAAIRLKQLEKRTGKELRVVVLEKGGEVGAYNVNDF